MRKWSNRVPRAAFLAILSACGQASVRRPSPDHPAHPMLGAVADGHHFMAAFEPDGQAYYTVERTFPVPGGLPKLVIQRVSVAQPDVATVVSFSGQWRDIDPVVTPDGRRLYFNSARPAPGRDSTRTDFDIWYVDRAGDGWGAPVRLPAPVNTTASEYFATPTRDGTLYYTVSTSIPVQRSWILRTRPTATGWTPAETLTVVGAPESTPGNPLVAADESWVIYAADKPGRDRDSDLWIVQRTATGWTPPRNLGPSVNTERSEFAPSVANGRLYFTRLLRGAVGGPPVADERVWSVPLDRLLRRQ